MAIISPLYHDWAKSFKQKRFNYLSCIEGKGSMKDIWCIAQNAVLLVSLLWNIFYCYLFHYRLWWGYSGWWRGRAVSIWRYTGTTVARRSSARVSPANLQLIKNNLHYIKKGIKTIAQKADINKTSLKSKQVRIGFLLL